MFPRFGNWLLYLAVGIIAGAIYFGSIASPPSLMDDVDAALAQMSRNMVTSGDWVTPRVDGIPFLEKPALFYWPMAVSYEIFGVHDWSARLPFAIAAVGLACLTCAFGIWAFDRRTGLYAGLCVGTCVGLFLFTRIVIPDVILTCAIAMAMWAFLRALDEEEPRPKFWACAMAASMGVGVLVKSLIGVVFPAGAGLIYLLLTKQLFLKRTWERLMPFWGAAIVLLIAAPWHVLATLRNPPYFYFSLHSGPGEYHGFLWFYFINEQLLRFLNMRYPRDYSTVPRLWFWGFHFLWLFPWSVYFPSVARLSFKPTDRAGRARLLALIWIAFILIFFTFSTTQEYYSMPCYPALALLIASGMEKGGGTVRGGSRVLVALTLSAAVACFAIIIWVHKVPTPGDISSALVPHPSAYKLSLGHMEDLTLDSFAYLRVPLVLAAVAFLVGAIGNLKFSGLKAFLASALMMVVFFHAARLAMVKFDPYLSSKPIAEKLLESPQGQLVVDHHYFTFSSIFFYMNRTAPLVNGRRLNLEYGSYAPGAPDIFLTDQQLSALWAAHERYYLVADRSQLPRFESLMGSSNLNLVIASGGKVALTNHPIPGG
ncbi:MAG TPA: glycosyltransferase family 39 protein [Candidatus Acidoferrum sp.]|nr:glycosyltransferase family 39 protein [Candidatus Acidoferrum sp.]